MTYSLSKSGVPIVMMPLDSCDDGYTREEAGQPNAAVCLASDQKRFFNILMPRLLEDKP